MTDLKKILVRPVLVESKEFTNIVQLLSNTISYTTCHDIPGGKYLQLILISLKTNNEIEFGDNFYNGYGIFVCDEIETVKDKDYLHKVIAFQSQISDEYIRQFIGEHNNGKIADIEIEMEVDINDVRNWYVDIPSGKYHDCEPIPPSKNNLYSNPSYLKPKLTNGFITLVKKKEKYKRKTYNHGFYDYYYKCEKCGSESISLKHPGGFQPADLICDECNSRVLNNKIQISDSEQENDDLLVELNTKPIIYTEEEVKYLLDLAWATASAYGENTNQSHCDDWFKYNKKN